MFRLIILLFIFSSPLYAATESYLQRYALIVGSNHGGDNRIPLRYANSDAISMAEVFEELGELAPGKKNLLLNPSQRDIDYAFKKVNEELAREKAPNARQEVIFYYSGHSDDKGLLLHDGRFDYTRLRKHLEELDVDVRLAMLDSCEAESFMKAKGGKRIQPLVLDDSNKVSGYVFLAASSENEAAQESKSIGGSFFTHYFVSALRGAADHTEDRRVTLNEAYQYAYNETIARTKNTRAGAQHAAYDIQLKGAGDLVLTDLNRSSSALAMDEDVGGRVYIHNGNGRLVVELTKVFGKRLEIGLVPDQYEVSIREGEQLWKATAELAKDRTLLVSRSHFEGEIIEETVTRGDMSFNSPRFSRTSRSEFPLRVSAGYMLRVMDFYEYRRTYSSPKNQHSYQGVNIALSYELSDRFEVAFDSYYARARGQLFGSTAALRYKIANVIISRNKLSWYAGLGASIDFLQGYHDVYSAPAEQLEVVEISSNVGPYMSTGLIYRVNQYAIEFLAKQKYGYDDQEKVDEDDYPELVFRVGYNY